MNAPAPRKSRLPARQKVVLIIDDEEDMRDLFDATFADFPSAIKFAKTAEAGLNIANVFVVDVVILDVFMPGKGGIWVIDKIKKKHSDVTIISMSGGWKGMAPERAVNAAKKIGADYGFAKPFDIWAIHDLVCEILDEWPESSGDDAEHNKKSMGI